MNDSHVTRLLNVDLDIRASTGLEVLLHALGSSVVVLNNDDPTFASVEIGSMDPQSIDEAVLLFFHVIQSLPETARDIWANAQVRSFNVGIQSEAHPHSAEFPVSARTLSLLQELNAEVVLTVYGPPSDSVNSAGQTPAMSSGQHRTSEAAE
jgi:hypothetical protein